MSAVLELEWVVRTSPQLPMQWRHHDSLKLIVEVFTPQKHQVLQIRTFSFPAEGSAVHTDQHTDGYNVSIKWIFTLFNDLCMT